MSAEHTGRCLCGGVSYRVTGELRDVWNCYCERCRRTTGHMMAASQAASSDVHVDSTDTLRWYTPADEPAVSYGFCDRCGASVFWRVNGGDRVSICAGTLDRPTGLHTAGELFTDETPDYLAHTETFQSFAQDWPWDVS